MMYEMHSLRLQTETNIITILESMFILIQGISEVQIRFYY